jgi:hypothetical protein
MINECFGYIRFLPHSPVRITGVDKSGLRFAEQGRVEEVSDAGCRFSTRDAVHQGSVLAVEPLGPKCENLLDEFPGMFAVIWFKCDGNRLKLVAQGLRENGPADFDF